MTKEQILERVLAVLPHTSQIKDLDVTSETAIRFTWRGDRFRVSGSLCVEQVDDGKLCGSNLAMLLEALIKGGS